MSNPLLVRQPISRDSGQNIEKPETGWDIYNNINGKADQELIKEWNDTLNSLLVFAALYSGIIAGFIIESMTLLEEDPQNVTQNVLMFIANQTFNMSRPNSTIYPYIQSEFSVDHHAITINALFFASLSLGLVVALAAIIILQWIVKFDAGMAVHHNDAESKAIVRHFRYEGAKRWKMQQIIASLPILLYVSLSLFFIGMIYRLYRLNKPLAGLVIAFFLAGILFFLITTILGIIFPAAPYDTPLSNAMSLLFWQPQKEREKQAVSDEPALAMRAIMYLLDSIEIRDDFLLNISQMLGSIARLGVKKLVPETGGNVQKPSSSLRRASNYWVELISQFFRHSAISDEGSETNTAILPGRLALQTQKQGDRWERLSDRFMENMEKLQVEAPLDRVDLDGVAESTAIFLLTKSEHSNFISRVNGELSHRLISFIGIRQLVDDSNLLCNSPPQAIEPAAGGLADMDTLLLLHISLRKQFYLSYCAALCPDILMKISRLLNVPPNQDSHLIPDSIHGNILSIVISSIRSILALERGKWNPLEEWKPIRGPDFVKMVADTLPQPSNISKPNRSIILPVLQAIFIQACAKLGQASDTESIKDGLKALSDLLNPVLQQKLPYITLSELFSSVNSIETKVSETSTEIPDPEAGALRFDLSRMIASTLETCNLVDEAVMSGMKTICLLTSFSGVGTNTSSATLKALEESILSDANSNHEQDAHLHHTEELIATKIMATSQVIRSISGDEANKEPQKAVRNDVFQVAIQDLINLLSDDRSNVRNAATTMIIEMAEQSMLKEAFTSALPTFSQLLTAKSWEVRVAAARALSKLTSNENIIDTIKPFIKQSVLLFVDEHEDVREALHIEFPKILAVENSELRSELMEEFLRLFETKDKDLTAFLDALSELVDREEIREKVEGQVSRIAKLLNVEWWRTRFTSITIISKLSKHEKFHDEIRHVMPELVKRIEDTDDEVQAEAIRAISEMTDQGGLNDIIKKEVVTLAKLLEDPRWRVRQNCVTAFSTMASHGEFHDDIRKAMPQLVAKFSDSDVDVRISFLTTFSVMSEQVDLQDVIKVEMGKLTESLKDDYWRIRIASLSTLSKISVKGAFNEEIEHALPEIFLTLNDGDSDVRAGAIAAIPQLAQNASLHNGIKKNISSVIQLLNGDNIENRVDAATALTKLAENELLHDGIQNAIREYVDSLGGKNSSLPLDALVALYGIQSDEEVVKAIKQGIPDINERFKSDQWRVQQECTTILSTLSKHVAFNEEIKPTMPGLMGLLKDKDYDVKEATVKSISIITTNIALRDEIAKAIPDIVKLLKDKSDTVRIATSTVLSNLVDNNELYEIASLAIPELIGLLADRDPSIRSSCVPVLAKMAGKAKFDGAMKQHIQKLPWHSTDPDDRLRAATALSEIAKFADLHDSLKLAIPELVQLLKDPDSEVRTTASTALSEAARHEVLEDPTRQALQKIIHLIKIEPSNIQMSAAGAFSSMASNAGTDLSRDFIKDVFSLLSNKRSDVQAAALAMFTKLAENSDLYYYVLPHCSVLVDRLRGDDTSVKLAAATVLAKIAENESFLPEIPSENFIPLLQHEEPEIRLKALNVLLKIVESPQIPLDKQLLPKFIQRIKDSDAKIKEVATRACMQVHARTISQQLVERILDISE